MTLFLSAGCSNSVQVTQITSINVLALRCFGTAVHKYLSTRLHFEATGCIQVYTSNKPTRARCVGLTQCAQCPLLVLNATSNI